MEPLVIKNRTICFGARTYQVQNITSVVRVLLKPRHWFRLRSVFICGVIGTLSLANDGHLAITVFFLGWTTAGVTERLMRSKRYGLQLELNSGRGTQVIASKDRGVRDRIIQEISQAMEREDEARNVIFNNVEGDTINQSGVFGTGVQKFEITS